MVGAEQCAGPVGQVRSSAGPIVNTPGQFGLAGGAQGRKPPQTDFPHALQKTQLHSNFTNYLCVSQNQALGPFQSSSSERYSCMSHVLSHLEAISGLLVNILKPSRDTPPRLGPCWVISRNLLGFLSVQY